MDACPWDKALWLQGVRELSDGVFSASERSDLIETMKTKGIHLRADMYEVMLEMLES